MKKITRLKKGWRQTGIVLFSLICFGGLGSCMDGATEVTVPTYQASDPNKPVTFTDFTPNEGAIRTRMYINGDNFGTDASLIEVIVGGQKAKVIHSSGTQIYCMVPARASGGYVEVKIKNADGTEGVKHTFEQKFNYIYNTMVGTLCGIVDEKGNSAVTDGTFDVAGFVQPRLMLFDNEGDRKDIYLCEGTNTIRKINLKEEKVETILKTGVVAWNYITTMVWSADKDTLFVNNDTDNKTAPGVYYFLRKENFSIPHDCVIETSVRCIFTNPYNPEDHGLYLIRHDDSGLYKALYNPDTQLWDAEKIGGFGSGSQLYESATFHPSGNFVYCLARDRHCIQKAMYNRENKTLESPNVLVGYDGSQGYADGVGTSARFNIPMQGVFVKNETYVSEGREDIYDFYLVDANNHCIRKVTPDGMVTTYAGRGSATSDGRTYGYIDGALRETARFSTPLGICYDDENATFYISDKGNRRIRTISIQ